MDEKPGPMTQPQLRAFYWLIGWQAGFDGKALPWHDRDTRRGFEEGKQSRDDAVAWASWKATTMTMEDS